MMESSGEVIGKEKVISKLKDDGDFDRLRLKIIRKLKDNVRFPLQIPFLLIVLLFFRVYISDSEFVLLWVMWFIVRLHYSNTESYNL